VARGPTYLEAEAAQLRALELFRRYFLRRFPDGVVISELEHLGATTIAPWQSRMIQYPHRPQVNKVLAALAQDYRRWQTDRDYRKSDGMGISGDGWDAELIEVTTVGRVRAADVQLRDKLDTLNRTVNRVHGLTTRWQRSPWRPAGADLFYPLTVGRFLSYLPTYTENAPAGVILYEVFERDPVRQPVPVPLPEGTAEGLRSGFRQTQSREQAVSWAQRFAVEHPVLMGVLRGLALLGGAALAVLAVVLIFDPAPGDEVAAYAAASVLIHFARTGRFLGAALAAP
jgi:hypothetical protein